MDVDSDTSDSDVENVAVDIPIKSQMDSELHREQMAALEEFRLMQSSQNDDVGQGDRRMEYLMQQSELFAHFLVDGEEEYKGKSKSRKSSIGASRGRVSEEVEDRNLMKMAQAQTRVVRLLEQPPSIVGGKMRSYQLEGLNWMIKLHNHGINGILADEMGLGKTLQTISILAYLKETRGSTSGPHMVIVPKSTVSNWMREFARWCPVLRAVRLLGSKAERKVVCQTEMITGKFDVLVASYESCLKEKAAIMKIQWDYLVIDEAHRIKNESSSLSKLTRLFPCQHRLLVTGTPLQNNLHELWALLNFLMPDIFSNSLTFDSWFNTADETGKENTIKKLHTVLKPFMLRRVKADVEKDLPPKKETKLYIGMTALQKEWYRRVLTKDVESFNSLGGPDKVRLLNILMQLRKVCNHPYLFEGAEAGPPFVDGPHLWQNCGKMSLLDKLLPKLQAQGSRVLIFCQMTRMLDILEDYVRARGYLYCRIDGSTDGEGRDAAMDDFNAEGSEKFCFLLSTRAGGLGINLATADTVILYDSDWNPQVDLQAMDRAHRIGQKKEVRVFRFITEGTVEEKIVERADRKLFLDAAVIQQGRLFDKLKGSLTKGEVMAMVKFGADEVLNTTEGPLTDEDIDTLLLRGEERTQAISSKLSTEVQHSLASFSVQMEECAELNMFTFEGENFKKSEGGRRKSGVDALEFQITLPQRERKRNFEDFKLEVVKSSRKGARKTAMTLPDFQFFNKIRLDEIYAEEADLANEKAARAAVIAKMIHEDEKAKRKALRKSLAAAAAGNGVSGITDPEDVPKSDLRLEAERLQVELDSGVYDLPAKLEREKAKLLAAGFAEWTKGDLKSFLSALERFGTLSDSMEAVVWEVCAETGKSAEDVSRYYTTFFKKYKSLADWPRYMDKVQKGQKRIERLHDIRASLEMKLFRHYGKNLHTLVHAPSAALSSAVTVTPWAMVFTHSSTRGRYFTDEEDRFLVMMMYKHGYGRSACTAIHDEICRDPSFRFDWFFISRPPSEIQKRCDVLLRAIEKENAENPLEMPLTMKIPKSNRKKAADGATSEIVSGEERVDGERSDLASPGKGNCGDSDVRGRGRERDAAVPPSLAAVAANGVGTVSESVSTYSSHSGSSSLLATTTDEPPMKRSRNGRQSKPVNRDDY